MPEETLSTSQIARETGLHPNTIRQYEAWGFLSPVPRAKNNYRCFYRYHIYQLLLVRVSMKITWQGGVFRKTTLEIIKAAADFDLERAAALQQKLLDLILVEEKRAEQALEVLEQWAKNSIEESQTEIRLRIGEAAALLGASVDQLRNWERNGLIEVPRDPRNGYRLYGKKEIDRLRVIRTLILARYSIMSILRMFVQVDGSQDGDLRRVLDTPREDEGLLYFTDNWLSTLDGMQQAAENIGIYLQQLTNSL